MAESKKDGGPAFPVAEDHKVAADLPWTCGMSLRDYFAAHAPAEPQSWFQPTMPHPAPVAPPPIRPETPEEKSDWYEYMEDMIGVEQVRSPRLAGLIREGMFYAQQLRDWSTDYNKQRLVQWPYAWADAMLAAREAA